MSPILGGIGGVSVRGFGHFPNLYFSSFDSIATVTVGAGGASSITFSSIPSTYTHLQLRILSRSNGNDTENNATMTFNGDTGNNYVGWHYIYGNGSTVNANTSGTTAYIIADRNAMNLAGANMFSACIIDILDYANTNKYKTTKRFSGVELNTTNGASSVWFTSGLWMNTNAITSLTITPSASFSPNNYVQYSSFALYGIKVA